ncbi:MAG TPA: hypothetical protein VGO93_09720 [Candidatus Xenobia bacterium]|jgi:hypothetical protein
MRKLLCFLLAVVAVLGVQYTPAQSEPNDPVGLTVSFYDWYLHQRNYSSHLSQQKNAFSSDLYADLQRAYSIKGEAVLDFDPFDNAQDEPTGYKIGEVQVRFTTAVVPLLVQLRHGGQGSLTVVLKQYPGRQWKITDFLYPPLEKGKKSWYLHSFLRQQLKSGR